MQEKLTIREYIDSLSSDKPTPGGGNAAGLANALGCSLMLMSLRIAVLKKNPEDAESINLEKGLLELREESMELAEQDSEKFLSVIKNYKKKGSGLSKAMYEAAQVSLNISSAAEKLSKLILKSPLGKMKNIITDVKMALEFSRVAYSGGMINCSVNESGVQNSELKELKCRKDRIEKNFESNYKEVLKNIGNDFIL